MFNPSDIDIKMLDSGTYSTTRGIPGAACEDLVSPIIEQPDLGVVVRLSCWHRDTELEASGGKHPGQAVECVFL